MSNTERVRESLVFKILQVAEYIVKMDRRLDELSEQFNNRPEIHQIANLQNALSQLHRQQNERSVFPEVSVEVVNLLSEVAAEVNEIQPQTKQVQSHEYQLVFDRSGSRAVLLEALEKAQKRLIIVSPWLSRNSIDADLLQKFRDCLNRNCRIDIGWGYLSGWGKTSKSRGNNAIRDLRQLEQDYPEQFKLKLLGTHEKFLVCDDSIAMLGSHNVLASNAQGITREVGIRTTDPQIIQGLINRFDGAELQEAQAIDVSLTAVSVNLDEVELDEDEDTDDSVEYSQSPAIDAEEFLLRYNEKERDFIGINLARVDFTSANLNSANLTEANLSGTNLTKANLGSAYLLGANLSKADLSYAQLWSANLTGADLSKAKLTNANLSNANLSGANMPGVKAVGVNFYNVKLGGADLRGADLRGANLSYQNLNWSNLTKADLRGANLEKANARKSQPDRSQFRRCKPKRGKAKWRDNA